MKTVPVNGLVDNIMAKYDADRNGVVEARNLSGKNELAAKKAWGVDAFSNSKLFEDVDAHTNQDGNVTRQELYYFIKTFDLNEDEQLTKRSFFQKLLRKPAGEYDDFAKAYKEIK